MRPDGGATAALYLRIWAAPGPGGETGSPVEISSLAASVLRLMKIIFFNVNLNY